MKIGFKNLRSLRNTGLLSIKPLTILLGQNSSGKSTFLRAFPLLKQSLETKTMGPILWYGGYVDFGDFSNALSDNSSEDFIEIFFNIDIVIKKSNYHYSRREFDLFNKKLDFKNMKISIRLKGGKENKTYASQMNIVYNDFKIEIAINKNSSLEKITINDEQVDLVLEDAMLFNRSSGFLPHLVFKGFDGHFAFESNKFFKKKIYDKIREISGKDFVPNTLEKIIGQFEFTSNKSLFDSIVNKKIVKGFYSKVSDWKIDDKNFIKLRSILITSILQSLITKCDDYISSMARNISYIAPLRATAERYYRPQDLDVSEVDFQGKNLALVLRNLNYTEKSDFENWCLENFSFYPKAKISGGNLTINVKFKGENQEHNIADLGFGFSQILPIITQMWAGVIRTNIHTYQDAKIRIYAIEQPELHLHPKFQSLLIDAIINLINYSTKNDIIVNFILETHSETIINAIGRRIHLGKLPSDLVNVIMFEKNISSSVTEVTEVKYLKDGTLENWPYGFFEESWNL